jgi:hypothetical protein
MARDFVLIAAPPCAPIRQTITNVLAPYGIKDLTINSWAQTASGARTEDGAWLLGQSDWVTSNQAYVWGNQQAIRWIEYLLLRSGRFQLLSKAKDARNESWALRNGNVMPKPWANEPCLLAKQRQAQQQQATRTRQTNKNKRKSFWHFW